MGAGGHPGLACFPELWGFCNSELGQGSLWVCLWEAVELMGYIFPDDLFLSPSLCHLTWVAKVCASPKMSVLVGSWLVCGKAGAWLFLSSNVNPSASASVFLMRCTH